ncbi:hypothetical protein G9A89_007915 [Geosiphon pyriformis]|nr:hypothetical protein G9A89_007915 [Geosiphon pyriformis]
MDRDTCQVTKLYNSWSYATLGFSVMTLDLCRMTVKILKILTLSRISLKPEATVSTYADGAKSMSKVRNAILDDIDATISTLAGSKQPSEFSENDLKLSFISFLLASTGVQAYMTIFRHESNEDIDGKNPDQCQDGRATISSTSISQTNSLVTLSLLAESMIGRVERTALIVENVNLENFFEEYRSECENNFE